MRSCAPKRRYRDRLDALWALAEISAKDRPSARERRAYPCPVCKAWHLTSQNKRGDKDF